MLLWLLRAFKSVEPVVVAHAHKLPLRFFSEKFRDPQLLEKRCRVCAWTVDGCPACWKPAKRAIGYKKLGSTKGTLPDGIGVKGSFAKGAVTHTHLTSSTAISFARRGACLVNVYIKAIPAGDIIKLRLDTNDTVAYMCWQYRNQEPVVGLNESMVSATLFLNWFAFLLVVACLCDAYFRSPCHRCDACNFQSYCALAIGVKLIRFHTI